MQAPLPFFYPFLQYVPRYLSLHFLALVFAILTLAHCLTLQTMAQNSQNPEWVGDFYEPDFPFFTSTLDAREIASPSKDLPDAKSWTQQWPDNLIPRGIIIPLNQRWIGCFDPDLLRWALIWEAPKPVRSGSDFLTMQSMAQISYNQPNTKTGGGQGGLSHPSGMPILGTSLNPGWIRAGEGDDLTRLSDPRNPGPDPRELGRGPLPADLGEWKGLEVQDQALVLYYAVQGVDVSEKVLLRQSGWTRTLQWSSGWDQPVDQVIGKFPDAAQLEISEDRLSASWKAPTQKEGVSKSLQLTLQSESFLSARFAVREDWLVIRHPASQEPGRLTVRLSDESAPSDRSDNADHFVIDKIQLPQPNPHGRRVRVSGMDFYGDGETAAVVTFDGDVWLVDGFLSDPSLKNLRWRRFASGLHEPQSIHADEDGIFVFSRNGIVRLIDKNADGKADVYENFCNLFAQSGETREFAMDSVRARDGSFYLAKGGQQVSFPGIHNGSILKVAPDGKIFEVFAEGLRQPFLGYYAKRDWLLASDQQGHYVPSTPAHWIQPDKFYGFGPRNRPELFANREVTEPPVWIPHRMVQSGAGVVWSADSNLGPLNDRPLYLDYFGPGIAVVYPEIKEGFNGPEWIQGASLRAPFEFDFPLLDGCIHPTTGDLYVCGFQIWGSKAKRLEGMARIRYQPDESQPTAIPLDVRITQEGVWMKWESPIAPVISKELERFQASMWNYKRSAGYGSGYFKLDGTPGQEALPILAAGVSPSRKEIFIALGDLQPVDQLEFGLTIPITGSGGEDSRPREISQTLFWTVRELESANDTLQSISEEDAGWIQPILSQAQTGAIAATLSDSLLNPAESSVEAGRKIYENIGCVSCHSTDGTLEGRTGPTFLGLFGKNRKFENQPDQAADAQYIKESLLNPTAQVVQGFGTSDIGMPSYIGILGDNGIESIILFIQSLKE